MEIDEDAQSRQLAVYGREALLTLGTAKVLISGLNGLGVEIAKNVSLAGVSAITLHDTVDATAMDLGAQVRATRRRRRRCCCSMCRYTRALCSAEVRVALRWL